jgi:hypothetical protein
MIITATGQLCASGAVAVAEMAENDRDVMFDSRRTTSARVLQLNSI